MHPIKANMKTSVGLGILVLLLLYCFSLETRPFDLALQKESLIALNTSMHPFTLQVPKNHSIRNTNEGVRIILNPGGERLQKLVIFKTPSLKDKHFYDETYEFKNGAVLRYSLSTHKGGSAGPIYMLKGQLSFLGTAYAIEASEQKQWGKGNPKFCLKYLSTLAPK